MNLKLYLIIAFTFPIFLSGCVTTGVEMVDIRNDRGQAVVGLDYRDFESAASESVQDMLARGVLNHPRGGRYVVMISRILNDTMQRIDTDQLVRKIRVEMLNSGRAVVTTAVGLQGAEDSANFAVREGLRGNAEFDQSRVQKRGTLQAPDLSLSGKILQRNIKMPGNRQQIEYYFMLTLTDLSSGLATWEKEYPVIKRTSARDVPW
jgi:penicillin-binding protein activator